MAGEKKKKEKEKKNEREQNHIASPTGIANNESEKERATRNDEQIKSDEGSISVRGTLTGSILCDGVEIKAVTATNSTAKTDDV